MNGGKIGTSVSHDFKGFSEKPLPMERDWLDFPKTTFE